LGNQNKKTFGRMAVKTITGDSLREITTKMNELELNKEDIISLFPTDNERIPFVCVYYTKPAK
jgi:hypothetical protein